MSNENIQLFNEGQNWQKEGIKKRCSVLQAIHGSDEIR